MAEQIRGHVTDEDPGLAAVKQAWGEHVKANYVPVHRRLGHSAVSATAEIAALEEQFQVPAYDPKAISSDSA